MDYTSNTFKDFCSYLCDILQVKTSYQILKSEEIIQVMQIAASLTIAQNIRNVETTLENLPKNLN